MRNLFVSPSILDENIAGVDIGKNGAIVYNYFGLLSVVDYSTTEIVKAFKECHRAIAEDVHPFKGQGLVSTGTLMIQKGIAMGVAAATGMDLDFIEPIEWIKRYTIQRTKHFDTKTKWKRHLYETAKEIFPEEYHDMMTLHNADAFLIWNYFAALRIGKPLPMRGYINFTIPSR